MRRKTLVPATHDHPAGTLGNPQRPDLLVGGCPEQSSEPPPSNCARISGLPSGLDPDDYNLRRRVERCLNLLKQDNVPLAMVFHDSGFDTEAEFVQAFSAIIGIAPSTYRENVLIAKRAAVGRNGPT